MPKILCVLLLVLGIWPGVAWAKGYNKVVRSYTESGRIFVVQSFHANLIWQATYLHPQLLAAQRAQWREWYHIGFDEGIEYPAILQSHGGADFIVAFYSYEKDWCALESDRDIWSVTLDRGDGVAVKPESIAEITIDPLIKKLYPHLETDTWSKLYRIHFARDSSASHAPWRLAIFGLAGQSTLTWQQTKF